MAAAAVNKYPAFGGFSPTAQTSIPFAGSDAAPALTVGPIADEVGIADVASQLRLCAGGVCGASVQATGTFNVLGTFQHLGASMGFFLGAPVIQQSITTTAGSATLTDGTSGGTAHTITLPASGTVYATDFATLTGNFHQLALRITSIETLLKATTFVAA